MTEQLILPGACAPHSSPPLKEHDAKNVSPGLDPYVRYWMATRYACGMLIVKRERYGRIVGGCPIYVKRWRGQTLKAFFAWHAARGGVEYEEIH